MASKLNIDHFSQNAGDGSVANCLIPFRSVYQGDARNLSHLYDRTKSSQPISISGSSVDLIVTSPPYWRKRNYNILGQIGQESTPEAYVAEIMLAIEEWRRVLRPTGSIFLNVGDTYWRKSLSGIPGMIEAGARSLGLLVRNRIAWVKKKWTPGTGQGSLGKSARMYFAFDVRRLLL